MVGITANLHKLYEVMVAPFTHEELKAFRGELGYLRSHSKEVDKLRLNKENLGHLL